MTFSRTENEDTFSLIFYKLVAEIKVIYPEWKRDEIERYALKMMRIIDEYQPYYDQAYEVFGVGVTRGFYSGTWKDNFEPEF